MAIVTTDSRYYSEIADAIRAVNGSSDSYTPAQMAAAILALVDSGYLPRGYTLLEYIVSTGTQYIDTGFKPNQDTTVIADVSLASTGTQTIFGARTSSSAKTFSLIWMNSGYYRMHYNNGYTNFTAGLSDPTVRHTIRYEKNELTIGDASLSRTYASFQCDYNLMLLAVNTANTVSLYTSAKLYACQIYDNGILVRQYVPCINPDGEVGMYDIVNGQFYGNAGTGTFTAGQTLVESKYIESSGTQYINTEFVPNQDSRMVIDIQTDDFTKNYFAGSRYTTTQKAFAITTDSSMWQSGYNNSSPTTSLAADADRHVCDLNKNVFSVDGAVAYEHTYAKFTGQGSICIGAVLGSSKVYCDPGSKFYYCKIYDNGVLVRDYIPCLRSDGIYGLYDKANNKFYTNAGSGSFTGG